MKTVMFFISILLLSSCAHNMRSDDSTSRHYVVVEVKITDVEKYNEFISLEIPILTKFGAFIAMDIRSKDQKNRYIIVSFPTKETVSKFAKSAEFQKILPMNKASSTSKMFQGGLYVN